MANDVVEASANERNQVGSTLASDLHFSFAAVGVAASASAADAAVVSYLFH